MGPLTIDEKTLQQLQTFSTVAKMNEVVTVYKEKYELNQTDRAILDAISRYACKYTGVCYLRKQSIAKEAGFVSRRTAIRSCQRLEALGIIKQYETRRLTGDRRQAANIIVIQPIKLNEQENLSPQDNRSKQKVNKSHRSVTPSSHPKKHLSQTLTKQKPIETYIETETIFKRGLKRSIPEQFYNAFAPFFDSDTLYEIYGILLRAKAKIDQYIILEHHADCYIDAFYNVLRLYKQRKIRHLKGYLYVTWERLSAEISRRLT